MQDFDIKIKKETKKKNNFEKKEKKSSKRQKKFLLFLIYLFSFFVLLFIFGLYLKSEIKNPLDPKSKVFKVIEIKEGEGAKVIAEKLEKERIIKNKYYFLFYVLKTNTKSKLQAGKYSLSPSMSIPYIVKKLVSGDTIKEEKRITIPEGFRTSQIEEKLKKELERENIKISDFKIKDFKEKYIFLSDAPDEASLEGYLFPDSYVFTNKKDLNDREVAREAVIKMLDNFDKKLDKSLREEIKRQNKRIYDIVIMASILEKEVKTKEDREIVSGIFWKRIQEGKPLESCATIAYILGKDKWRYSFEETRIESPYNTYLNKGLPKGPISNPGLDSIKAAIYPKNTDYNYFLTDPKTEKTIFAKTALEHEQNQEKYFSY